MVVYKHHLPHTFPSGDAGVFQYHWGSLAYFCLRNSKTLYRRSVLQTANKHSVRSEANTLGRNIANGLPQQTDSHTVLSDLQGSSSIPWPRGLHGGAGQRVNCTVPVPTSLFFVSEKECGKVIVNWLVRTKLTFITLRAWHSLPFPQRVRSLTAHPQ